jgi:hypothetical protein
MRGKMFHHGYSRSCHSFLALWALSEGNPLEKGAGRAIRVN